MPIVAGWSLAQLGFYVACIRSVRHPACSADTPMLNDFIIENRAEIIRSCREKLTRHDSDARATLAELDEGVPHFLDEYVARGRSGSFARTNSATLHASALLRHGYTLAEVVHDYGGICQAITELAAKTNANISVVDFKSLNQSLDDAIAEAVTEYSRLRESEAIQRKGMLAHEIRGILNAVRLGFEMLKVGEEEQRRLASQVVERGLDGMAALVEQELTGVRIGSGTFDLKRIGVRDLLEHIALTAGMSARTRGLDFSLAPIDASVTVRGDVHVLTSVVWNLLENAFKFTRPGSHVALHATRSEDRVIIEVSDQCGGIPGDPEALFEPYAQKNVDRSGMGLGLAICRLGAERHGGKILVRNEPGVGCTFTLALPA